MMLDKLRYMDISKQLAFAYLTCKRLLPNYTFFSSQFQFGNPSILEENISFIRVLIIENKWSHDELSDRLRILASIIPNTEDFDTIYVSSALDAGCAIEATYQYLLTNQFQFLIDISTYATDTVDMFIQERNNLDSSDPVLDQRINEDPLMVRERKIQEEIIEFLTQIDTVSEKDIDSLLTYQSSTGNIGIIDSDD